MKFKKIASVALALSMMGTALVGCGGSDTLSGGTTNASDSAAAGSSVVDSAKAPERKPVELVWYVGGSGPQADTPAVLEEISKYLKEKINASLKIVENDWGSYDQKMQMVIASQEKFDLCYTAHWSNNFYNNVSKNAFLELDELVDKYAAELKTAIPQGGWDAAKVKGKIYAVPNMQIWAMTNGLAIVKEYADKYNFDVNSIKSLKDIEPLLAAIKKDNPKMYPFAHSKGGALDFLTFSMGYDELVGRHIPGAVKLDDQGLKVINQFELPQVQEHYKMMYNWNKKGYIRPDAATVNDLAPELKAGKHAVGFVGTVKPGDEVNLKNTYGGKDVVVVPISESWLPTSGITATMTAVSRTSENPDRAMEFLNLVNADKNLYNLITMGIDGKHYEKVDDTYIRPIKDSAYNPNADWMYGNQFNAFLKEGQEKDVWEKTDALNKSAKPSVAIGFAFDPSNIQNEIASVSAVVKEYELSLDTGSIDPEKVLPEFIKKLEQAGSKTIIAEVQKQVDAWKAAK